MDNVRIHDDSSALHVSFYYMNIAILTGMVLICHAKASTTIFTIPVRFFVVVVFVDLKKVAITTTKLSVACSL